METISPYINKKSSSFSHWLFLFILLFAIVVFIGIQVVLLHIKFGTPTAYNSNKILPVKDTIALPISPNNALVQRLDIVYSLSGSIDTIVHVSSPAAGYKIQMFDPQGKRYPYSFFIRKDPSLITYGEKGKEKIPFNLDKINPKENQIGLSFYFNKSDGFSLDKGVVTHMWVFAQ